MWRLVTRNPCWQMEHVIKAIECTQTGSFENLAVSDVADPKPGPGEVVVAVEAAVVNYVDSLIVLGRYQIQPPTPFIPGVDIAGTIVATGEGCSQFEVGDRVHGMSFLGGFAERVAVRERALRPTPDGLTAELAATTGTSYRTAIDALVSIAHVSPGDDVVILGAAGGVGSAAIGIAKALGARVVACASTESKRQFCKDLGADEVLDYTESEFKSALKQHCAGGADVVLDLVGGPASEQALRATGYGGRFVVVGFASGTIPSIPLNLILLKGCIVRGYEIADFERRNPEEVEANRSRLESLLVTGALVPPITARYPFEEAASALERAAGRDKAGLTILDLAK